MWLPLVPDSSECLKCCLSSNHPTLHGIMGPFYLGDIHEPRATPNQSPTRERKLWHTLEKMKGTPRKTFQLTPPTDKLTLVNCSGSISYPFPTFKNWSYWWVEFPSLKHKNSIHVCVDKAVHQYIIETYTYMYMYIFILTWNSLKGLR